MCEIVLTAPSPLLMTILLQLFDDYPQQIFSTAWQLSPLYASAGYPYRRSSWRLFLPLPSTLKWDIWRDICSIDIAYLIVCVGGWTFSTIKNSTFANFAPSMLALAAQWTRLWVIAERDGRPAEYRWRPLFNAAKFDSRPLLECGAVTMPRRETRWNLQGCPKLANRSQPLVGRRSL